MASIIPTPCHTIIIFPKKREKATASLPPPPPPPPSGFFQSFFETHRICVMFRHMDVIPKQSERKKLHKLYILSVCLLSLSLLLFLFITLFHIEQFSCTFRLHKWALFRPTFLSTFLCSMCRCNNNKKLRQSQYFLLAIFFIMIPFGWLPKLYIYFITCLRFLIFHFSLYKLPTRNMPQLQIFFLFHYSPNKNK